MIRGRQRYLPFGKPIPWDQWDNVQPCTCLSESIDRVLPSSIFLTYQPIPSPAGCSVLGCSWAACTTHMVWARWFPRMQKHNRQISYLDKLSNLLCRYRLLCHFHSGRTSAPAPARPAAEELQFLSSSMYIWSYCMWAPSRIYMRNCTQKSTLVRALRAECKSVERRTY